MTAAEWAALLVALGVGTILPEVFRAIVKGVSGKIGRERDAVQYERDRAKKAEDHADMLDGKLDDEIVKRRVAEAKAARFERLLILHGIRPDAVWTGETTIPTRELGKEES